jgi:Tol biopolymer transport system component
VGLAANCTVTGTNVLTVSLAGGETETVNFAVECIQILVDLQITTTTTGQNIDPDGYTFAIDGDTPQAIGVNDSETVSVAPGTRSVALAGLAANCAVAGSNPKSVSVAATGSTVEFVVTCSSTLGTLVVTTTTSGADPDPNGYTVTLDGGITSPIGVTATVTLNNIPAGDRTVTLTGVAPNCTVTAPHPRTVTVPANASIQTDFAIVCTNLVGSVQVTTATSGSNLDPDGYMVTAGAQPAVAIGVNETKTVSGVVIGMRSVQLSGVASNCTVSGENPRMVNVTDGGTTPTTFTVTCIAPVSDKIVFDTNRDGNSEIYSMSPNGSGVQRLTNNAAKDGEPNISPDGAKIAFVSDRDGDDEIWVMNGDGTNPVQLTSNGFSDKQPAWSPDGTKIAFRSNRSGNNDIWVMNADGSGAVNLTANAADDALPDWSPDGTKIVFNSTRDNEGDHDVHVMNADGSNVVQLTDNDGSDYAASWSPSGAQIAFTSEQDGDAEVYVMNADGSSQVALTDNTAFDGAPQWSPDGTQIAFGSARDGNVEVYTMTSAGGSQTNITNNAAADFEVDWR